MFMEMQYLSVLGLPISAMYVKPWMEELPAYSLAFFLSIETCPFLRSAILLVKSTQVCLYARITCLSYGALCMHQSTVNVEFIMS